MWQRRDVDHARRSISSQKPYPDTKH